MEPVQTLIDKAVNVCGSQYRLAKLTGLSQGNLSEIRAGKRHAPVRLVAEAAALIGADVRSAVLAAEVENQRDDAGRLRMAELLGIDWRKR